MQIKIPPIVRPLPLADYAPELGAVTVFVWVNPPAEMLLKRESLEGQALFEWWAELWSKSPDTGTHWTGDQVRDLIVETHDTDPGLPGWLVRRSWDLINAHRDQEKKA